MKRKERKTKKAPIGCGQYEGGFPQYWFPDEEGSDEGWLKTTSRVTGTYYLRARRRLPEGMIDPTLEKP